MCSCTDCVLRVPKRTALCWLHRTCLLPLHFSAWCLTIGEVDSKPPKADCSRLHGAQATVHRTWIVSEEGLQQHHAAQAARENDADQYTTLTREMQQLGTPWLNILKVRSLNPADTVSLTRPSKMAVRVPTCTTPQHALATLPLPACLLWTMCHARGCVHAVAGAPRVASCMFQHEV